MRRHAARPSVISGQHSSFTRRMFIAVGGPLAATLALLFAWFASDVLLLLLAGLLLAIFLRRSSDWLSKHTPLSEGWALGALLTALACAARALIWFCGGRAATQIDLLAEQLPALCGNCSAPSNATPWAAAS